VQHANCKMVVTTVTVCSHLICFKYWSHVTRHQKSKDFGTRIDYPTVERHGLQDNSRLCWVGGFLRLSKHAAREFERKFCDWEYSRRRQRAWWLSGRFFWCCVSPEPVELKAVTGPKSPPSFPTFRSNLIAFTLNVYTPGEMNIGE
jgi:hypothetical protein